MKRFAAALMLCAISAGAVADERDALCVNGKPAPRRSHATYGGLAPSKHGLVRDHICPLGLGCPDTRDNVKYQPKNVSLVKDRLERWAIENYCSGVIGLEPARSLFRDWRSSYKLVFGETAEP